MKPAPQELRTYFVTTATAGRRRIFQVESAAELLIEVLQHYRDQRRYALHAFVVMPDHLHILLTPAFEVSLEKAVQFIKGGFSYQFHSKMPVWERSFNESQMRDSDAFEACRRYIELNPVRARLAASPDGYSYSSVQQAGFIDPVPRHFCPEKPAAKAGD